MDPAQLLQALEAAIASGNLEEIQRLRVALAGANTNAPLADPLLQNQPVMGLAPPQSGLPSGVNWVNGTPPPISSPWSPGVRAPSAPPPVARPALWPRAGADPRLGSAAFNSAEMPGAPVQHPEYTGVRPRPNTIWEYGAGKTNPDFFMADRMKQLNEVPAAGTSPDLAPPEMTGAKMAAEVTHAPKPLRQPLPRAGAQPIPPPPSMTNGGVSQAIEADLAGGNAAMQGMDANMARADAAMAKLRGMRPNTSFSQVAAPYGAGAPPAGGTPTPGAAAGAEAGALGKYLDAVEGGDVTKVASSIPKTVPFGPEMGVNPSLLQRGLNAVKPALPFLKKLATKAGQAGAVYGVGKDALGLVGAADAARDPYAAPISNIASMGKAVLDALQPQMVKDQISQVQAVEAASAGLSGWEAVKARNRAALNHPVRPQMSMQGIPIVQHFDPAGIAMSTANALVNAVPGMAKSAYDWLTTAPERPVVPKTAPDLGPDGIPWNEEGKPFSMLDPLPPELARDPLGGAVPTPSKSTARPARPARPRVGGSAEKPDNFWGNNGANSAAPTSMLGMKFHSDLIPEFGGSSAGNPGQQVATRTRFGGVVAAGLKGPVANEGFRAPLGTKDPTAYRDVTSKGTTQPFKHGSFFGAFDPTKPNVGALLDATGKVDPSKYTRSSVDPKTGILSPIAVDEDNTPFDADDMSMLAPGGDNSFLRNQARRMRALRPRARPGA